MLQQKEEDKVIKCFGFLERYMNKEKTEIKLNDYLPDTHG